MIIKSTGIELNQLIENNAQTSCTLKSGILTAKSFNEIPNISGILRYAAGNIYTNKQYIEPKQAVWLNGEEWRAEYGRHSDGGSPVYVQSDKTLTWVTGSNSWDHLWYNDIHQDEIKSFSKIELTIHVPADFPSGISIYISSYQTNGTSKDCSNRILLIPNTTKQYTFTKTASVQNLFSFGISGTGTTQGKKLYLSNLILYK